MYDGKERGKTKWARTREMRERKGENYEPSSSVVNGALESCLALTGPYTDL